MKLIAGNAESQKLFRDLSPGETFKLVWQGTIRDYLTLDLVRGISGQQWDFRVAADLASGAAVWLPSSLMVMPTMMEAQPVRA